MADGTVDSLPAAVTARLIDYLTYLRYLGWDTEWVRSRDLAEALGVSDALVRKDLSRAGMRGHPQQGYAVGELRVGLAKRLGVATGRTAVVFGAGPLGRALVEHGELSRWGIAVCGIFDTEPRYEGKKIDGFTVRGLRALREMVASQHVEIGVVAVPTEMVPRAVSELKAAGVRGLLNLTSAYIPRSADLHVVDAGIAKHLQELTCALGPPAACASR
jgi:redox-sensing transcriptional repressor